MEGGLDAVFDDERDADFATVLAAGAGFAYTVCGRETLVLERVTTGISSFGPVLDVKEDGSRQVKDDVTGGQGTTMIALGRLLTAINPKNWPQLGDARCQGGSFLYGPNRALCRVAKRLVMLFCFIC